MSDHMETTDKELSDYFEAMQDPETQKRFIDIMSLYDGKKGQGKLWHFLCFAAKHFIN